MKLDVIIPTYGRLDKALEVAQTVRRQLNPEEYVYVIIQSERFEGPTGHPGIRLLFSSPPNLPRARNRGMAESKADAFIFLDDDVEVQEGFIDGYRAVLIDPGIGAVAGWVDDPMFVRSNLLPSVYHAETGEFIQNFSCETECDTISVMGVNMAFRRDALIKAGPFDEGFERNALTEDIDMALRVARTGLRIRFCPRARVRHLRMPGGCRTDKGGRYLFYQFANIARFACRHMERKHLGSWLRFWWYRLEYLTRSEKARTSHNPLLVITGICGAAYGIVRYLFDGGRVRGKKVT